MYQFRIIKLEDGENRFELGNIKMLVGEYSVNNEQHVLANPDKAFAYFTFDNNIYGISNELSHAATAEALYENILDQYQLFSTKGTRHVPSSEVPYNTIAGNAASDHNSQLKRSA